MAIIHPTIWVVSSQVVTVHPTEARRALGRRTLETVLLVHQPIFMVSPGIVVRHGGLEVVVTNTCDSCPSSKRDLRDRDLPKLGLLGDRHDRYLHDFTTVKAGRRCRDRRIRKRAPLRHHLTPLQGLGIWTR